MSEPNLLDQALLISLWVGLLYGLYGLCLAGHWLARRLGRRRFKWARPLEWE